MSGDSLEQLIEEIVPEGDRDVLRPILQELDRSVERMIDHAVASMRAAAEDELGVTLGWALLLLPPDRRAEVRALLNEASPELRSAIADLLIAQGEALG